MKILVVGSGGREHTLCWKMVQSPMVTKIYCTPGNAGISSVAETIPIDPSSISELSDFGAEKRIDLTVVGPELPLILGLFDEFQKRGLKVFGASAEAARLEGSKVFAKEFMARKRIPTADFRVFDSPDAAVSFLKSKECRYPTVVKADGLAAGKGVIICQNRSEAEDAVRKMMVEKIFGASGERIIIEDCLQGREVSFLLLSDGEEFIPLASSQDYKRALDNDEGPNTGGMGSYSPSAHLSPGEHRKILDEIVEPTITGMMEDGRRFKGILYCGLMLTDKGPRVLEYNVRFGDPEAQVILPRMESDLVPLLLACAGGSLKGMDIKWSDGASVCVVMASGGYPGSFEKGKLVKGLNLIKEDDRLQVFHAGTSFNRDGDIVTSGGRVLGINALGETIEVARNRAYDCVGKICFEGMHFRKDIALDAL
ncbi:MAG: phosphoribosylamine--glycine ligase [Acidobacteriota bacterium]